METARPSRDPAAVPEDPSKPGPSATLTVLGGSDPVPESPQPSHTLVPRGVWAQTVGVFVFVAGLGVAEVRLLGMPGWLGVVFVVLGCAHGHRPDLAREPRRAGGRRAGARALPVGAAARARARARAACRGGRGRSRGRERSRPRPRPKERPPGVGIHLRPGPRPGRRARRRQEKDHRLVRRGWPAGGADRARRRGPVGGARGRPGAAMGARPDRDRRGGHPRGGQAPEPLADRREPATSAPLVHRAGAAAHRDRPAARHGDGRRPAGSHRARRGRELGERAALRANAPWTRGRALARAPDGRARRWPTSPSCANGSSRCGTPG